MMAQTITVIERQQELAETNISQLYIAAEIRSLGSNIGHALSPGARLEPGVPGYRDKLARSNHSNRCKQREIWELLPMRG